MKFQLSEVMSLKWTAGLTVGQALEVARTKQIDILANYRYWAFNRSNEAAFQNARENALIIAAIIETLEAAVIAQSVAVEEVVTEVQSVPQTAAKRKVDAPAKVRCSWCRSIRKFYACAQEVGLPTDADSDIRKAVAAFFGLENFTSRKQLSGGQWEAAAEAVRFGYLAW